MIKTTYAPGLIAGFFLVLASLFSCKSASSSSEEPQGRDRLLFGQGGGFTGMRETYILERNGKITLINTLTKDTTQVVDWPRSKARGFFKQWEALDLSGTTFDHPGNAYYFVMYESKNDSSSIMWGELNQEPPAGCKELYKAFRAALPKP